MYQPLNLYAMQEQLTKEVLKHATAQASSNPMYREAELSQNTRVQLGADLQSSGLKK